MPEKDALAGGGLCAENRGQDVAPGSPYLIPAQLSYPLPRRRLSPSALVTSDVPCMLCCVRLRQDEDGDGVRKEDGHVMNF